jgi:phospholipid/cholesterol/gamma-HCH transport system permease protein
MAAELAQWRLQGALDDARSRGQDPLRGLIAPRALAGLFAVLLLAAVAGTVALVLAYVLAHGLSPWALERYARMVGHVFSPAVSLVFVLKTAALALAVSVVPIGTALHGRAGGGQGALEVQGLTRMFLAALLVEVAGLAGNYL